MLAAGVKQEDTFSATLFNTALNIVLEGTHSNFVPATGGCVPEKTKICEDLYKVLLYKVYCLWTAVGFYL